MNKLEKIKDSIKQHKFTITITKDHIVYLTMKEKDINWLISQIEQKDIVLKSYGV